jgi:fructose-specific phosphotransferase system IIC component
MPAAFVESIAQREELMGFILTIIIGFVAGVIAKFLMPGKNEPSGFILTK